MEKGVIYFNLGTKCLLRIAVSIHSLRKYYDGPVSIISTGKESNEIVDEIFGSDDSISIIKAEFDNKLEGKNAVYLKKAAINLHTPYRLTVFLDADTLIRGPINELFELAKKSDFVVPQFTHWTTNTRQIKKRINGWASHYPELMEDALNFGPAVNCGVFAFKKDTEFVNEWSDRIIVGRENFIPDETGMQVILHQYKHYVCDQKYNVSCKYSNPRDEDVKIIHYHGKKHCRLDDKGNILYHGDLWLDEWAAALADPDFKINIAKAPEDRMVKRWKSFKPKNVITDKRITIVTAVNPPYLEKLKITLPTWQKKPQLKDSKLLVFHNGFDDPTIELSFIEEISGRDVTLVEWSMDQYDSLRELMLSAFVLGAPKYVDTPYWLKIDADAYFTNNQDIILDHFYEYDLAGHKWKYTKPGAWIANLDDWAFDEDLDGEAYLNDEERAEAIAARRYGHKRIASFVCLHKTEFTKEVLNIVGKRLPVPSHDTFLWYLAERLPDRKWCWHSYKKLGCGNQTNIDKLRDVVNNVQAETTTA